MPRIIDHIDHIAISKQRDVMYLQIFSRDEEFFPVNDEVITKKVTSWLNDNNISWWECAMPSNSGIICGGPKLIYLDIPFVQKDQQYQLIESYLENKDGSMKIKNCDWFYLPLTKAIEMSALSDNKE